MRRGPFLGGLGATATGVALTPRGARADAITLRAASSIDDDATPFLYAIQSGAFAKAGLSVSLDRATSGAAVIASVVGGAYEMGKSSITSLCGAFSRGLPVVLLAPAGEFDASLGAIQLIVKADGPIATGADLTGKTVGVSALNDYFSLSSRAWIDAHGGDSSTIRLVEVPMPQIAPAVATGRIDTGACIQPFLATALDDGKVRAIGNPGTALGNHYAQSAWFTTAAFAAKNPAAVDAFMRTMRDAATYANGHHAETAVILANFTGTDPAKVSPVRIHQGVRFDVVAEQPLIDLQAKYKMIPQAFDVRTMIYPPALH